MGIKITFISLRSLDSSVYIHQTFRHEIHFGSGNIYKKINLQNALQRMRYDGFTMREWTQKDTDNISWPSWVWGHKKGHCRGVDNCNLPDGERISVLMFHLNRMLKGIQENSDDHYCFVY